MSSSYTTCAACKFFRRECAEDCVFFPYFPPDKPKRFISVHIAFGASNVAKYINELRPSEREETVNSLICEAAASLRDPVHGSPGLVSILQYAPKDDQTALALSIAKKELATMIGGEVESSLLQPHDNPSSELRQQDKMPMTGIPTAAALAPATVGGPQHQLQMNKMLEKPAAKKGTGYKTKRKHSNCCEKESGCRDQL